MAMSWSTVNPDNSKKYHRVAIDEDASVIVSLGGYWNDYDDGYFSSNGGSSWTSINYTKERYAYSAVCDSDGSHILIARAYSGKQICYSVNSGSTWSCYNDENYHESCDCDADGSVGIAAVGSGTKDRVLVSTDSFANWSGKTVGSSNAYVTSVCCSRTNGSVMYAGTGARLYKSTDTGANWSEVRPAGDTNKSWGAVACSSDGSVVIACVGDHSGGTTGSVYTSTDSGANWTERTGPGTACWDAVDMSDDGDMIILGGFDNGATNRQPLYWSKDGGANWTKESLLASGYGWCSVRCSGDGTKFAAGNMDYDKYVRIGTYTAVVAPTVTTQDVTDKAKTTGTGNGNITNTGGENCTRRGFCYKAGTSGDPTTADSVVYDDGSYGTGAYTKGITGLSAGTAYRVRAYAVNSEGTGYGTTVDYVTTSEKTLSKASRGRIKKNALTKITIRGRIKKTVTKYL